MFVFKLSIRTVGDSASQTTSMYKGYISIIIPVGICCVVTTLFASIFPLLRTKYNARKRKTDVEEMVIHKGTDEGFLKKNQTLTFNVSQKCSNT